MRRLAAVADAKGEICDIDIWNHGGVGYGAAGVNGVMDMYVNGVLSTDYIGAYDHLRWHR